MHPGAGHRTSPSKGELFPAGHYKERELGVGLELVPSFALAPRWLLLLRPRIAYARVWTDLSRPALSASPGHSFFALSYVRLALSVPVVFELNDHVGIGAGPDLLFGQEMERNGRAVAQDTPTSRVEVGASVGVYVSF